MPCLYSSPQRKFSIIISHANVISLKIPAQIIRSLEDNEHHILIALTCRTSDNTCKYTLRQDLSLNLPEHMMTEKPLTSKDLITLIKNISQTYNQYRLPYCTHALQLCCDANLGSVGGNTITNELNTLVYEIKPRSLFLFTDTPDCVNDASRYLNRKPAGEDAQCLIPNAVKNGFVCERMYLQRAIQKEYGDKPTLLPSVPLLHRFFPATSPYSSRDAVPLESSKKTVSSRQTTDRVT